MKKAGWEPAFSHGWEWDNMDTDVGKVKGEADVIFFDAAGTLIYLARPVGWHYALIARKHGLEVDEARMEDRFSGSLERAPRAPSLSRSARGRRSTLVAGTRSGRAADRMPLGCLH